LRQSRARNYVLGGDGYGLYWWKRSYTHGNQAVEAFFAWGNGGNYIFVIPPLDLVVVFTGTNYGSPRGNVPSAILADRVLPAVR
jgi:CubicO group peptidase (beta-lactamase class C family)